VTSSSLSARWSRRGALVRRLLKERLVHVVASDSHSASWRPPDLRAAADLGRLGTWLTDAAPRAILAGTELPAAPRG
jgi:tyrosine-protein phosphatase YwqE